MNFCLHEPTLAELLNDGLTQGLMHADKVDVEALHVMLRDLSATIVDRKSSITPDYFAHADRIVEATAIASASLPKPPAQAYMP